MSRIPDEIFSTILRYTMRSEMPVHLEHFLEVGRQFRKICHVNDTKNPGQSASTSSELWFLDQLDPGQIEHFRDWLLINSTCRLFRAWGKEAFFWEKVFVVRPEFLKTLTGETAKGISAENSATARSCIRHVIAPIKPCRPSETLALPQFHALQRLRSMSIRISHFIERILGKLHPTILKRYSLRKEFNRLLRGSGLRVDQLQMDVLSDHDEREYRRQMELLADRAYPCLRIVSTLRAGEKFGGFVKGK